MKNKLLYSVLALVLFGCSLQKEYESTLRKDNFYIYKRFLIEHPNSKYNENIEARIIKLEEKRDWHFTTTRNTIDAYNNHIKQYPNGEYSNLAKQKIKKLEIQNEEKIAWEEALRLNQITGYQLFIQSYPKSKYRFNANAKIKEIRDSEFWESTQNGNTITDYKEYISMFPNGKYVKEAEEAIIDLKVDEILNGEHGMLPSMEKKASFANKASNASEITVINATGYTLTVLYSGTESKQLVLSQNQISTISLKNGDYRVAATVNANDVSRYAGNEKLDGSSFEIKYYIKTSQ